jgi:hypothetical protein
VHQKIVSMCFLVLIFCETCSGGLSSLSLSTRFRKYPRNHQDSSPVTIRAKFIGSLFCSIHNISVEVVTPSALSSWVIKRDTHRICRNENPSTLINLSYTVLKQNLAPLTPQTASPVQNGAVLLRQSAALIIMQWLSRASCETAGGSQLWYFSKHYPLAFWKIGVSRYLQHLPSLILKSWRNWISRVKIRSDKMSEADRAKCFLQDSRFQRKYGFALCDRALCNLCCRLCVSASIHHKARDWTSRFWPV